MEIKLTKKQYRELLLDVIIGVYIRGAVEDMRGKDFRKIEDLEEYILSFAKKFDSEDMVEIFKGTLLPSDKVCKEYEEILEDYNDDEFWSSLVTLLGKRDFGREMTKEDREYIKKNKGWLPEKVHRYYEEYEKEFEKHGIERLEIKKD